MKIGFTGTQEGMTAKQKGELLRWLNRFLMSDDEHEFIHGMCIGADAEAHRTAWALNYAIVGWPCDILTKRAYLDEKQFVRIKPPLPPLERNHFIVGESELLIAAPRQREEVQRSGTWATIRQARKVGRTTLMVWP